MTFIQCEEKLSPINLQGNTDHGSMLDSFWDQKNIL